MKNVICSLLLFLLAIHNATAAPRQGLSRRLLAPAANRHSSRSGAISQEASVQTWQITYDDGSSCANCSRRAVAIRSSLHIQKHRSVYYEHDRLRATVEEAALEHTETVTLTHDGDRGSVVARQSTSLLRGETFESETVAGPEYGPSDKLVVDLTQAESFANLQTTVYCNVPDISNWNCTRCGGDVASLSQRRVMFDPDWDLLAMAGYWEAWNSIFVVFRGTDSKNLGNWIHDVNIFKTPYFDMPFPGFEDAMVHHGFFYCLNASSLAQQVSDSLADLLAAYPDVPVYFMGHSLGAALATIAAPYMKVVHGIKDARLWTFGSPRVGNLMFATLVESIIDESVRFTHGHDPVPAIPFPIFGYHHVTREIWQLPEPSPDEHMQFRQCNRSGEDPTCHNSICRLGLCHSLVDHVRYLGKHMYHNVDEC